MLRSQKRSERCLDKNAKILRFQTASEEKLKE
uniref:Uncharacterized protein n=1 Tax=Romanomermis culicivorax TaxID=13658 RepID=A0A915JNM8_ROMCU